MESVLPLPGVQHEVRYMLKCYQTATSAHQWKAPPRPSASGATDEEELGGAATPPMQGDHDSTDGIAAEDSTETDTTSVMDRLAMDRIFSLMGDNCRDTYLTCVSSGCLETASVILKMHLHDELPLPCDELLESIDRTACSTNGIVDWLRRDALPSLHRHCLNDADDCHAAGVSIVENVCELLLQFAKESERICCHPFDAIAASELAVHLASSALNDSSERAANISAHASAVHKVLELQAAAWTILGLQVNFGLVEKGGLHGILDVRLRGVDESSILHDVNDKLRPMMASYGENVDDMLFSWITDTLRSSVVMTDVEEVDVVADGDGESDFTHSSVQVTRLVNVAQAIRHPNLKARAVISLLQMLSAPASVDISSDDSSAVVFEKLSSMRDEVHGVVSSSISDSLIEAFRTHKLRVIASKYSIRCLHLRDPRQVREAVGLIVTKVQVPTSMEDALCFAESYSSSGVDICGVLVRGLVHRILPHQSDLESDRIDREEIVSRALRIIPHSKLCIVVEDTCSLLVSVVNDICEEAKCSGLDTGYLPSKVKESEFMEAINGILQVSTYLLDAKCCEGNASSDVVSAVPRDALPFGTVDNCPGSASSRSIFESTVVTQEFQFAVKQLKKLYSEFSYFVSLNSLWDKNCCIDIIRQTTNKKCEDILMEVEAKSAPSSPTLSVETASLILSQSTSLSGIRKLCSILCVSFVFALQNMQRYVLAKGHMVGLYSDSRL